MKVLMYNGHHALPFWQSPSQPEAVLNSDEMGEYMSDKTKLNESWVWPILKGLLDLDSHFIAHVSIGVDPIDKSWSVFKRFWVQVTTAPKDNDPQGIPLVVQSKEVQVKHIWGGDNGTRTPYDFLPDEETLVEGEKKSVPATDKDSAFWSTFFEAQIANSKKALQNSIIQHEEAIAKIKEEIALYESGIFFFGIKKHGLISVFFLYVYFNLLSSLFIHKEETSD